MDLKKRLVVVPLLLLAAIALSTATTAAIAAETPTTALNIPYSVKGNMTVGEDLVKFMLDIAGRIPLGITAENVTVDARGGGTATAKDGKAEAHVDASVVITGTAEPTGQGNLSMKLVVETESQGEGLAQKGTTNIDFKMSIPQGEGMPEIRITFTGTAETYSEYIIEENRTTAEITMEDGELTIAGIPPLQPGMPSTINLKVYLYLKSESDFNKQQQSMEYTVRLYSEDRNVLVIISNYISYMMGTSMPPVNYDAAKKMYYIEFSGERTEEMPPEALVTPLLGEEAEALRQAKSHTKATIVFEMEVREAGATSTARLAFSVKADATAEWPKPYIPLTSDARLRSLDAVFKIEPGEDGIYFTVSTSGEIETTNPYLATNAVKVIKGIAENAEEVSITIKALEPVKLMMKGKELSSIKVAKENIGEVLEGLRAVYRGVSLEEYVPGVRAVYRVVEKTQKAVVEVRTAVKEVVVEAGEAAKTVEVLAEKGARKIEAMFANQKIIIQGVEKALEGRITLSLAEGLRPPEGYRLISVPVEVQVEKEPGKLRITLSYQGSAGDVKVGHYKDGTWEILDPVEVDRAKKLVTVEVESLSAFAVLTPEQTETTTTTTPTTTTTTTTTVTETTTTTTQTQTTTTTTTQAEETETATTTVEETTTTTTREETTPTTTKEKEETSPSPVTTTSPTPSKTERETRTETTTPGTPATETPSETTATAKTATPAAGGIDMAMVLAIAAIVIVAAAVLILARRR